MIDIDVDHQTNAVRRSLGKRVIDTGETHVVTISQSYDTDPTDLWDAVTNVERIPGGSCRFPVTWRSAPHTSSRARQEERS